MVRSPPGEAGARTAPLVIELEVGGAMVIGERQRVRLESDGGILTVRFTRRGEAIRIIGAGYWRKGKAIYEKENPLHE